MAEEGVAFREIAEAIGRWLDVSAKSLTSQKAETHLGPPAVWVTKDGAASNEWARTTLGWTPEQIRIVANIERPDSSA